MGFSRIAQQGFHFGRAEVAWVYLHDAFTAGNVVAFFFDALAFPTNFDAQFFRGGIDKIAHAVLHARRDHKVFRLILLQHQPLHFNVVLGMSPVTQGVHIAKV